MEKRVKVVKLSESMPEHTARGRGNTRLFSTGLAGECEVLYQWHKPGHLGAYHVHNHAENVWVVMQGELRAIVGGVQYLVQAGEAIFMPAGVAHATGNRGTVDMFALDIYAPPPERFEPHDSFLVDLPSQITDAARAQR